MKQFVKRFVNETMGRLGLQIVNAAHTSLSRRMLLLHHMGVDTLLDVGANRGQYASTLRAHGYAGRIVSFEPLSEAYGRLAELCTGDPAWECHNMALGKETGRAVINIAGNSASSSLRAMEQTHAEYAPRSVYCGSEEITVQTLDAFLAERPDLGGAARFLKIDTQGFEMEVLEGAAGTLPSLVGIQVEMSLVPLYTGQALFQDILDHLLGRGFAPVGFEPGIFDRCSGRMLQVDGIFAREDSLGAAGPCAS